MLVIVGYSVYVLL